MSGLSEAALHVQAMRFVCKALADREQQGIEVDWDVLRQMHDQMDAMIQALQHKHRYDSSDMVDLRKDRDHWRQARQEAHEAGELMRAEIETLRQQLADAQRAVSDAFGEVNSVRQQLDAAQAAVSLQRAGIERLQAFVEKIRVAHYCDNWPSITMALDTLDAGTIEPTPVAEPVPCPERQLSEEMQDAVSPSWAPLVWDLRRRLRESQQARGHELERLRAFVEKVREWNRSYKFQAVIQALYDLDAGTEPAPVAEPRPCPECERLRAFVQKARQTIGRTMNYCDVEFLLAELAELDTNSSATLASSVVKESLTPEPEGGQ